ncbi:MAG: CDP-glycerol glycerophosphotransferase family protein [Chlamydiota bacterium]
MESDQPLEHACSICLAPGDSVNHLDHLAVIAYILDIPLITDEELLLETTQKYYPQVKPIYIQKHAQILEFLATHYDALFVSSANYRKDLSPLFEVIFRKKLQFWYCPHGNSDKPMKQFGLQQMSLIYGDQMEERLAKASILPKLKAYVKTGNYRLCFYQKYEQFYDTLVEEEVFSGFKKRQRTLLYAPTWHDLEASSSLFDVGKLLTEQLPDQYNLIVKLHPWLEHHHSGLVNLLREKYQSKPNVVILTLYPLVFPILKRVDLYLGDFSSIGYDFLYFNRPMFFFDPASRKDKNCLSSNFLHTCGTLIPQHRYQTLYSFIEAELDRDPALAKKRREVYDHAFGASCDFSSLRQEVEAKVCALSQAQETHL